MATDARVRYTKMMVEKSFVELLKTQAVQRITVKEICEMAEINRATFYKHYLDVYDLLEKIEDGFLDEMRQVLSDRGDSTVKDVLTYIMVSFKSQEDTYKAVCSPNGDPSFPAKVFDACYRVVQPKVQTSTKALTATQREWLYQYVAHGCNGVLSSWMAKGMQEPISEVADFAELLLRSTVAAIKR